MKDSLHVPVTSVTLSGMSASKVIQALGGSSATGRLCGVSSQAVSQWKLRGFPPMVERYLRLLRPDAFKAK